MSPFPPFTGVFSLSFFAAHGRKGEKDEKGELLQKEKRKIQRLFNSAVGMKALTSTLLCNRGHQNR